MNLRGTLRYHVNVDLVGKPVLRVERIRSAWKLRHPKPHPHLGPPLSTSPRLKELISRHYLKGQFAEGHKPVAWVTSGAPMEFLVALGYHVHYPENHGAVCGIRRVAEEACAVAEDAGYSPDICSYARTDFGTVLSGKTPVGRVPKPDLLVCCNNICQTVLYWYRVLADHFHVPLAIIDTPFLYAGETPRAVAFVAKQIEAAAALAEQVAGRTLTAGALEAATRRSQKGVQLWSEVLLRGAARPAPLTAFDEFIHMAPIVEMRGEQYTIDYYRALLGALDARIARGEGALKHERKRVIWDNLPVWPRVRWLAELLAEQGVAMVASTYTNAWGELVELIDPADPILSGARTYLRALLNRSTGHKLRTMEKLVRTYHADGVILHSDRSCKPYSIGQMDQRDRLGEGLSVPALLLDADHSDPRVFSPEQASNRLAAFIEILEA